MRLKPPESPTLDGATGKIKMSSRWRIIDTGPLDPFSNMAFDEALLRGYQNRYSAPTLRVYGWKEPSLSLGYSQDPQIELDLDLCRKRAMPVVRRITGGGIILHGNELTYSLVCSKEDLGIPARVLSSYKIISSFLTAFYGMLGIDARFACDVVKDKDIGRHSTVCFAAQEKYDIVVNGRKIGGSAQKRCDGVIFQHGSIPIGLNEASASSFLKVRRPEDAECGATCLEDILGKRVNAQELSGLLVRSFAETFRVKTFKGALSAAEEELFSGFKEFKYSTPDWNLNRVDGTLGSNNLTQGLNSDDRDDKKRFSAALVGQ